MMGETIDDDDFYHDDRQEERGMGERCRCMVAGWRAANSDRISKCPQSTSLFSCTFSLLLAVFTPILFYLAQFCSTGIPRTSTNNEC